MSQTNRNAPCWCGSKLKYKNCHLQIDSVPPGKRVQAAHIAYQRSWSISAKHFGVNGHYRWMSDLLQPFAPRRIFDVGCGDGTGVSTLLSIYDDAFIVSIDENKECLKSAADTLRRGGKAVELIERLHHQPIGPRSHSIDIEPHRLRISGQVALVESDFLMDDELFHFLMAGPKFDAMTIWLIGSHRLRYHECINLQSLNIESPYLYRLRVQNLAYTIASKILRSGGALQIVDRSPIPSTSAARDSIINSHREQSTLGAGMEVQRFDFRPYTEAEDSGAIKLVREAGSSEASEEGLALTSVISVKV